MDPPGTAKCSTPAACKDDACATHATYSPWYAGRFQDALSVVHYWRNHYEKLREKNRLFSDTFYDTTLPAEVVEAVAANLTILKSPIILRKRMAASGVSRDAMPTAAAVWAAVRMCGTTRRSDPDDPLKQTPIGLNGCLIRFA